MPTHQQIHQARRNGTSSGQFVQGRSINVHHTVDLLVAASMPGRHAAVRRAASFLLERMAEQAWQVAAGPHVGGHGGDGTAHITIRVRNAPAFHVRLDAKGHPFQITGPGLADATHPWQAPGQPSGPGDGPGPSVVP